MSLIFIQVYQKQEQSFHQREALALVRGGTSDFKYIDCNMPSYNEEKHLHSTEDYMHLEKKILLC